MSSRTLQEHSHTFNQREAPHHILDGLREIDPTADLLWIGEGWILGCWNGNAASKKKATRELAEMDEVGIWDEDRARKARILRMCVRGFRPVHIFDEVHANWSMVEEFRERDFNWRNHRDKTFEERFKESQGFEEHEIRRNRMSDFIQSELPTVHRIIMKARKSLSFALNPLSKES